MIQLADAYDYTQPAWEWYRTPSTTGSALWTEPYFDEGAGDIAMCTFSTPFFGAAGGEFFGEGRFQETLAALASEPVDELCRRAAERIEHFQQSGLQDDVTMLALRRSPVA